MKYLPCSDALLRKLFIPGRRPMNTCGEFELLIISRRCGSVFICGRSSIFGSISGLTFRLDFRAQIPVLLSGLCGNSATFHGRTMRYFPSVIQYFIRLRAITRGGSCSCICLHWVILPDPRQLGTAVELLRFVLRMYELFSGCLGTAVD